MPALGTAIGQTIFPSPQDVDEVKAWDTVQGKLSFSDRFGLTRTFPLANQEMYLRNYNVDSLRRKINQK
jgi:predicted AAA+ superfamily ATPase